MVIHRNSSEQTVSVKIVYQIEPNLTPDEFVDLLRRSTLAERRPVEKAETIRAMLENADVIVTARAGSLLVGVSRAITDFAYCTYLSDLAVDTWSKTCSLPVIQFPIPARETSASPVPIHFPARLLYGSIKSEAASPVEGGGRKRFDKWCPMVAKVAT